MHTLFRCIEKVVSIFFIYNAIWLILYFLPWTNFQTLHCTTSLLIHCQSGVSLPCWSTHLQHISLPLQWHIHCHSNSTLNVRSDVTMECISPLHHYHSNATLTIHSNATAEWHLTPVPLECHFNTHSDLWRYQSPSTLTRHTIATPSGKEYSCYVKTGA